MYAFGEIPGTTFDFSRGKPILCEHPKNPNEKKIILALRFRPRSPNINMCLNLSIRTFCSKLVISSNTFYLSYGQSQIGQKFCVRTKEPQDVSQGIP